MNINKIKEISFNNYEVREPYPEITENNLTQDEISIIKNIYVGSKGEMTSVNQYSYQHILLYYTEDLKNFSHSMERISINEMIHLEILGKLLLKSNIDPKFCKFIDNNPNICDYWSTYNVNYTTSLKDILVKNIELESIAIREYKKLLQITNSQNLKDIINRILKDEDSHMAFFNEVLSNV